MLVKDVCEMVHDNAVKHGWWDEERSLGEIVALIHSEWSEALEEARQGRPNVYKVLKDEDGKEAYITPEDEQYALLAGKPEGFATELIDGCIRILDLFGKLNITLNERESDRPCTLEWLADADEDTAERSKADVVTILHTCTSSFVLNFESSDDETKLDPLLSALMNALSYVKALGIDPVKLLFEKHRYNLTRPYKHGKQF